MALQNVFGNLALDATISLVKTAVDAAKASVDLVKTATDTLRTTLVATLTDGTQKTQVTSIPEVEVKNDAGSPLTVAGTVSVSGTLPVSGPLTDTQLRATTVPVSGTVTALPSGTQAVSGPATDAQLRATALPVTGPLTDTQLRASLVPVSPSDNRSVVERMGSRSPATGYHLWLDVTSSNPLYIYVCEAPDGATPASSTTWRGIRITLDASGNPLGSVATATNFAWDNRATASWVV